MFLDIVAWALALGAIVAFALIAVRRIMR